MVFVTFIRNSKRIPLIKFRKGGLAASNVDGIATTSTASPTNTQSASVSSSGQVIEDWQLPPRYHRKPLDETEIDYINRGGPA